MALNVPIFEALAPEFAGLSSTVQRDTLATLAETEIDSATWGDKFDQGLALLTAHKMKLAPSTSVSNTVVSEKVGDLQVNYAVSADSSNLDSSGYGKSFKQLRKQIVTLPIIV